MVALDWERSALPHSAAMTRLVAVAAFAAAWFALVWRIPELGATFNNIGVVRIAVHAVTLWGLWLGLGLSGVAQDMRVRTWFAIAIPFTLWLAAIWALAVGGVFEPRPPVPGRPPIPLLPLAIFLPTIAALVLLLRSKRVTALLNAQPAAWLVGLQAYRVFGGIFLINYARGLIPGEFALPAGIGDVTVGLLALPAAAYVASGTALGRRIGIAWNLLGLLDFVSAISLGFMTSPGPF
jgi:hypothetical protein